MPDFEAEISPEPIRPMFNSDREHARAWLAWAEQTPGGWRARLADKMGTNGPAESLPPAWAATVGLPGLVPSLPDIGEPDLDEEFSGEGPTDPNPAARGLVRYVEQSSPCCVTTVVLDPEASWARHGICAGCGTVLRRGISHWEPLPPTGRAGD
jgi:hypothetical protein